MSPFLARRIFAVLAVTAFLVIIWLGLGMTFFADEWSWIEGRSLGDPATWWRPHNEHWTTLSILLYRVLVETVGIGSYVPYLALAVGLHIVVCVLVYVLLERSSGPLVALIGGTIVLFFGSGFEDLYWAFQMDYNLGIALGLGALVVTDGPANWRRAGVVAGLLLAALMSSGFGIVMSFAVGAEWVMVRRWRRFAPILFIPAAAFLTWFILVGRTGLQTFGEPLTVEAARDVPVFVVRGLSEGLGAITGLPALGLFILIGVVVAGIVAAAAGRLPPRAIALFLAIVLQFALTGFARAQLYGGVIEYAGLPRYTYVSGILALLVVGALVGTVTLPEGGRSRLATLGALGVWAAIGLQTNIGFLLAGRGLFLERADMTRALVMVALASDRPPGVDLDRSLVLVPSPISLQRIVAAYGDPRTDQLVPWAVRPIPAEIRTEAQRRLVEGAPVPGVDE